LGLVWYLLPSSYLCGATGPSHRLPLSYPQQFSQESFSYRLCFLWVIFDPFLPYLLLLSYGSLRVSQYLQPTSVLLYFLPSSLSLSHLNYSIEKSLMSFVSNPRFVSLMIALLCIIPLIICITCPAMTVISVRPSVTANHS